MADETETEPEVVDTAPGAKQRSSKPYLAMIKDAERYFGPYNEKCDNIEKRLADLDRLANTTRDREFQMFWANMEVLKPTIYSRPPIPVVTVRFKDRKPLPREAAELLERCSITNFNREDIDTTMKLVRDDLAVNSRGVAWCWYEVDDKKEQRARIAHVDRRDFLHEPARYWHENGWVARGSWMTRKEARKRFSKYSGKVYASAEYAKRKDADGEAEYSEKARFWELWSKVEQRIVWVSPNVDVVLDEATPDEMLTLDDFFPCPKPAYGTIRKGTQKPIPDFLLYKDQLEEINELTARISALSESLRLKGFYASGAEDIADAIEAAIKATDNRALLVPVSSAAAFGGKGLSDSIVWLPIEVVAETITSLVNLRRQLIEDVYQITGLSDIMRGATDPKETLGAQQLKSQYGSIRIRERQAELVRLARDLTRIQCEIMSENFSPETLAAMSQSELPTVASLQEQANGVHKQMLELQAQVKMATENPQIAAMAQQQPEQAQQIAGQAQQQMQAYQGQIQTLQNTVTLEAVVELLRDQRLRPFILDIETDSTIQPDEDAAKQRATEFATAVGGFIGQAFPMVQAEPQLAPFVGEMLKFVSNPFRAGRALEGTIDELVEKMKQFAGQPKPDPNAAQREAEAKKQEQEMALRDQEAADKKAERDENRQMAREQHDFKMDELRATAEQRAAEFDQKRQMESDKHSQAMDTRKADTDGKRAEMGLPNEEIMGGLIAEMAAQREASTQAITAVAEAMQQGNQTVADAVNNLAAAQLAPKQIVKDAAGKPVGIQAMVN